MFLQQHHLRAPHASSTQPADRQTGTRNHKTDARYTTSYTVAFRNLAFTCPTTHGSVWEAVFLFCTNYQKSTSPFQVVHLFLSPKLHQLSWVYLPKPVLEAIVILDVAVSVLELVQCCLEDLDSTLGWDIKFIRPGEMCNLQLLSRHWFSFR